MTLRRRITAALLVATLLMLAVVAAAGALLAEVRRDQDRVVTDFFEATQLSNRLFVVLLDAETAVRGYALTGAPGELGPFAEVGSERTTEAGAELRRLLAGEPEVLAALDQAGASAATWLQDFAQPTVEQVQQQGAGSVSAAQVTGGRVLFDQVRADYDAYVAAVRERRLDALDELRSSTTALFALVVGSALAAVAAASGLALALRRWVTEPVSTLAADVRQVRDGDLDHPVRAGGAPELSGLAADVDAMRRSLVQQIAAARTAGEEVARARELLEEQAADLERSNRDLEQFAYVASHDLQEPLRKVASFCQLLQRRYEGQLDERADQYIAFAVDGAKRMQQLINDLLTFSRVGRSAAEREPVALDDVLERALRNLAGSLEASGARVDADPLPVVLGEAPLLVQLLQNLVGNAVKFQREHVPPVVRLTAGERDGQCEVAVTDNGIGVEPQYADRVFVIFQRLHPKERYEGTGIGLAMCKKIVEYHGGTIALEPGGIDGGPGTTVRFTLPAVPEPAPEPEPYDDSSVRTEEEVRA